MNKIYKVITNAKGQAQVVCEFAKANSKGALKSLMVALVAAGVMIGGTAYADDPAIVYDTTKNGLTDTTSIVSTDAITETTIVTRDGVDYVTVITGVNNEAAAAYRGGTGGASYDWSAGQDVNDYQNTITSGIAIGKNSFVYNQGGSKADAILFGKTHEATATDGTTYTAKDYTSGIAIGENSKTQTSGIAIGIKSYEGLMGDTDDTYTLNDIRTVGVGSTQLGSNSYTGGILSTSIGSYSIMTTNYLQDNDITDRDNQIYSKYQNFGAVSVGSLNSIESYTSTEATSGVANSVVGLANRTNNANGATIIGSGNNVEDSIGEISTIDDINGGDASVAAAATNYRTSAQKGQVGGAVTVLGNGNTVSGATKVVAIGSNNTVSNATAVVAVGSNNTAAGNSSTVVGASSSALGDRSQAFGSGAVAGATLDLQGKKDAILNSTLLSTLQKDSIETAIKGATTDDELDTVIANISDSGVRTKVIETLERATGADSIAQGTDAYAVSARSAAIGKDARVGIDSTNSIAQGTSSRVAAHSPNSIALGTNAKVDTKSQGAIAIGLNAEVINDGLGTEYAVALGANSKATRSAADLNATAPVYGQYADQFKDVANTANYGEVNVGTRVIGGVVAGREDTDAVNVAQWKSTALGVKADTGEDSITLYNEALMIYGENGISTKIEDGAVVIDGSGLVDTNERDSYNDTKVSSITNNGEITVTVTETNYKWNPDTQEYEEQNSQETVIKDIASKTYVDSEISRVDGRIDVVEGDILDIKIDIGGIHTDIENIDKRVTNVEELAKQHTTVVAGDYVEVLEGTNIDGGKEYTASVNVDGDMDNPNDGLVTDTQIKTYVDKEVLTEKERATAEEVRIESESKARDQVLQDQIDKGLNFGADNGTDFNRQLGDTIRITGDDNITTTADNGTINVALNKDIKVDSVTVNNKTYINKDGINANDQKITNVYDGEISADSQDAVNGRQLYKTNQEVARNAQRINKLDRKVNKVGAGAAALAALHPLDFDPDDKLQFSAGLGNYKGENAGAIGLFYRPDEKVMFSLGGTVGNDENMVNAGVTFSLDRTARHTNTKTAMAKEILDLRSSNAKLEAQVAKQDAQIAQLVQMMNSFAGANMQYQVNSDIAFPDVPENHWAYEYINGLAQRGIIEGYINGTFGGDRTMTRYEFGAMLYRALLAGEKLSAQIEAEFHKEIEEASRIRVDRISGEDNDKRKVERVRTNGNEKDANGNVTQYRDHYGSKIVPVSNQ